MSNLQVASKSSEEGSSLRKAAEETINRGTILKQILPKCNCNCHINGTGLKRPTMAQLHRLVEKRKWNKIKRALRNDISVAMRIDDSVEEDKWFWSAREAVWKRDVCGSCINSEKSVAAILKEYLRTDSDDRKIVDTDQALPVRYWVPNQNIYGQSAIRQKRTLLHSISKLKFHSDEALIAQLSSGDCEELNDLVDASLTVKMIIDASVNELRPIEDGCYNEERHQVNIDQFVDKTCQNCSCFYQCMYCPPVGLDPVEKYSDETESDEEDKQPSDAVNEKILHKSALTMTDSLGATPLHLLTGEGSAHVDLIRIFLDGCRTSSVERPSIRDLFSTQNGHGCTPLHFLSDSGSEEALRIILEKLQEEYDCKVTSEHKSDQVHPLLIGDNEGDLPLHYSCSHGANSQVLSLLTASPLTASSVTVRNSEGKLAIDELLIWYKGVYKIIGSDGEDEENESSDEYEASSSSESGNDYGVPEEDATEINSAKTNPEDLVLRAIKSLFETESTNNLSLTTHCKHYLWDRMWILIQTGAKYLFEAYNVTPGNMHESHPIHAAVLVTKYFDFPAIALVASVIMTRDADAELNNSNHGDITTKALLREDSAGLLPLHLACGSIPDGPLLSRSQVYDIRSVSLRMALHLVWPETVRWNENRLQQCSMIDYLLHLCPESARNSTPKGRLPLQLYLGSYQELHDTTYECSRIWENAKKLLVACPDAIRTPDISSHMYPFQTAAALSVNPKNGESGTDGDISLSEPDRLTSLELTYRLILEDPSLCRKIV